MKESKYVHSVVIVKDNMYFIADRLSVLYSVDLKSWTLKRVKFLEKNRGWWSLHYYGGCLYCTSFDDGRIAEYDLITGEINYYCPYESITNSKATYEWDGNIWFLPEIITNKWLVFSIEIKKFKMIDIQFLTGENQIYMKKISRHSKNDRKLCISTYSGESIIEINMDTFKGRIIGNPCAEPIYDVIEVRNSFYIISKNKGKIMKYNSEGMKICDLYTNNKFEYRKILTDGNIIFLDAGKEIFRLDNNDNIVHSITIFNEDVEGSNFKSLVKHDKKCIFLPWQRNCFLEMTYDTKEVVKHFIDIPIEDALRQNNDMMYEGDYSLLDYVGIIGNQK